MLARAYGKIRAARVSKRLLLEHSPHHFGRTTLAWHREKAGSIEAAHAVIRNELAGEVLPCGRFGANAADAYGRIMAVEIIGSVLKAC